MAMQCDSIPILMKEIDELDEKLVHLLAQRFRCSREIGAIKLKNGGLQFDPKRISSQRSRFLQLAVQARLDATMSETLISIITDQVIAERGVK